MDKIQLRSLKESLNEPSERDLEGILDAISMGDWLSVRFEILEYSEEIQKAINDIHEDYVKYFTERDDDVAIEMEESLEKKRNKILKMAPTPDAKDSHVDKPVPAKNQFHEAKKKEPRDFKY